MPHYNNTRYQPYSTRGGLGGAQPQGGAGTSVLRGTGGQLPRTNYFDGAHDELGAALTGRFNGYTRDVVPFIDDQLDSLNDGALITQADGENDPRNARNQAANQRAISRAGLGMTAAQRTSLSRQRLQNNMAVNAGNINTARTQETTRRDALAPYLASLGAGIRDQGMANLTSGVQSADRRRMRDNAARQQASSGGMGMIGGILSSVFAAAMMG